MTIAAKDRPAYAPDTREHHADREFHPLSRPWLRGLIVSAFIGDITYEHAQQMTAYYAWIRRCEYRDLGDAFTDWLEAADMLNNCAEACELAVLPW